ncbi:MAG: hypothetical protein AABY22_17485 [Nanoarchaeota archaeon]
MKQIKVYVLVDKKTGELISYINNDEIVFDTKKKNILAEFGSEIKQAVIEVKIKGLDF